jgi:hypothetical protein
VDLVVVMLVDHKALVDLTQELQGKEMLEDLEQRQEILVELVVEEEVLVVSVVMALLEIILAVLVVLVFNYQHHLEIHHQR